MFTRSLILFLASLAVFLGSCAVQEGDIDLASGESQVSGQVLGPDGQPRPNVQVLLHGTSSATAQTQLRATSAAAYTTITTTTDSDGRFQLQSNFQGKAYLVTDLGDSLGSLDSVDFSTQTQEKTTQILRPKGLVHVEGGSYPAGTRIWIPQLNIRILLETGTIDLKVPAGSYQIEIVVDDSDAGTIAIIVPEKGTGQATQPAETGDTTQNRPPPEQEPGSSLFGSFTDPRDLRTYKTVVIGTQTWMAENLDFGTLDSATSTLQSGSVKYCHMNLKVNCETEGGLYQWHYAMGLPDSCATANCSSLINPDKHQGICPDGWHMPASDDWDLLGTTLGGATVAGASMKLGNTGYASFDSLYNDGNSSGFSAYPVGIRYFSGEYAYHGGASDCSATFWEAEEESSSGYMNAYRRIVNNQGTKLKREYNHAKADAFSIRCVKD